MNEIKYLASIGGDCRRNYMVSRLNEYGIHTDILCELDDNINFYDGFILPLPATTDGIHINSSTITIDEFTDKISDAKTVFIGKADEYIKSKLESKNIRFFDYYMRDEFALKNAEPTALGVLRYVMNNSLKTVSQMKLLVMGYGKCAGAISRVFKSLGSDVTSVSRRYLTVAQAQSDGIKAHLIKDLEKIAGDFDVIVNTVPFPVITENIIDKTGDKTMLIDISSAPYGFDYEYAKKVGRKINLLPSLPGRCFPETAGNIIADTILNIIEEGDFE